MPKEFQSINTFAYNYTITLIKIDEKILNFVKNVFSLFRCYIPFKKGIDPSFEQNLNPLHPSKLFAKFEVGPVFLDVENVKSLQTDSQTERRQAIRKLTFSSGELIRHLYKATGTWMIKTLDLNLKCNYLP